jgi:hypothetical protein
MAGGHHSVGGPKRRSPYLGIGHVGQRAGRLIIPVRRAWHATGVVLLSKRDFSPFMMRLFA